MLLAPSSTSALPLPAGSLPPSSPATSELRRALCGLGEGPSVRVLRRLLPDALATPLARVAQGDGVLLEGFFRRAEALPPVTVEGPAGELLTRDVARLVETFFDATGASGLRVQLACVATDSCRKLHEDWISARLVVTYSGPGTEWVPDELVRREALRNLPADPDDANRAILRDPRAVRRASAGDLVVLRGHLHPGAPGLGGVHRSPPVEATGARRLVLAVTDFGKGHPAAPG